MKKTLYVIVLTCGFLVKLNAQTITCDYSKWPDVLKNESKKFNPNVPFIIEIDNINAKSLDDLLKNSSTSKANSIDIPLSVNKENPSFIKIDSTSNKATINVINMLSGIKEGESVDLKLKKNEKDTGITYSIFKVKNTSDSSGLGGASTTLPDAIPIIPQYELQEYFDHKYGNKIIKTDVGFKMKLPESNIDNNNEIKKDSNNQKANSNNKDVKGKDKDQAYYTIHIFLDPFGNTLFGSMPTGVQRRYHYIIHILYAEDTSKKYTYSLNVISGSLSDALTFYNSNVSLTAGKQQSASTKAPTSTIQEAQYNLFPTSDDLSFDLNVISINKDGKAELKKIQSYILKKSPFYFGSLNIGGVYTWVKNPKYQLVNSPVHEDKKTVKTTDNTSGVMATLLYTVYWSPINAIFPSKDGFKYHSWGRSYLDDDGAFFRKIYPCLGFGLQDQVFTNIIVGLDYQPMQGFGLVVGSNIRKVNTFNKSGFMEGETDISQDEFDFYQNTKWKAGWTVGLEIDLSIFNKIVGSVTTAK